MSDIPLGFRLVTPSDPNAERRIARLRELNIKEEPDPELDEFARSLAMSLNAPFAMVNVVGPVRQYFAGLYPSSLDRGVDPDADPFRSMGCEYGFCTSVVTRGHAMALDEVMDYHLFAGNPVVGEIGVHAYLGAPLIDHVGPIGTICVVDTEPHDWGLEGVAFIKDRAAVLVDRLRQRAGEAPLSGGDRPQGGSDV